MVMRCLLIEEIGRVNCGFAAALLGHVGLATIPLIKYGTAEQKAAYLRPALAGEKLGCFGLSEPNSGSDAASLRTTAVRDGDAYVINGSKIFITNGTIADYCMLAAYTDRSRRGSGISMFVVDTSTPGYIVSKKLKKLGHHTSETAVLAFENMRVPASALLGGTEGGFAQVTARSRAAGSRTRRDRSASRRPAFETALKYAGEREQFGQKIGKFQAIKFKLARMAMEVETARTMVWRAAWLFDQGVPCMKEAAMAKLFASEAAQHVSWEALQIHGGYGYITEFPVERYFRDARLMTITEGTSEIQLTLIARELGI
jgi:alkylation response protein AidB-like acyl-CoA dehydrogenase